jgi:hypothetical protein
MAPIRSLSDALERIRGPRTTVTTYGPERPAALHEFLGPFDVELSHERLPVPATQSYLTVQCDGEYRGSAPLESVADGADPPPGLPRDDEREASGYRDLTALLAGTAFTSVDRRQLLATSREIEDRAWRVGRGTLYAGFQSLSAYRSQLEAYRRLATETALDVRVYGAPDWTPPRVPGVHVHSGGDGELGAFWFVVFGGGGDDEMACALVAEEGSDGRYCGAWTYDPDIVGALATYLDATYGAGSTGRSDGAGEDALGDSDGADADGPRPGESGEQNG